MATNLFRLVTQLVNITQITRINTQKGIQNDSKILQKENIYHFLNQLFILQNLKYVILVSL
jgi:hypothetical protein